MRVLVVEDDRLLGDGLEAALRQAGYDVEWVTDGRDAMAALEQRPFAAVVLDLGLPGMEGDEVLKRARRQGIDAPVLILTARDTTGSKVAGLDAGADDYLVKPFDLPELMARLRALIRRRSGKVSERLRVGALTLDAASHEVWMGQAAVEVSPREFAILQELMENAGRVLSREQIEQALYGWGDDLTSNAVEVHIHHLRRKLSADAIRTIRGVGYMLPR